jgi:type I restriction enzyme S subunit
LAIAETPVSVNQGIIAMLTGEIPNSYLLLWAEENMEVIKARAGGSTFAEISKGNFRLIPALRPDKLSLTVFGEIVQPFFRQIISNEGETRVLAAIRDTLLPKLISGAITLPSNKEADDGQ